MRASGVRTPELTYVELVEALFKTLPPTLIMTALFLGTGILAWQRGHDPVLLALLIAGGIASAVRIAIVLHGRVAIHQVEDAIGAQRLERRFAAGYLPFALILGLFAARMTLGPDPELRTLAAVLVVGYAAGVATGIYVRPWISVGAILLAVAPLVVATGTSSQSTERLLGLVLIAFAAGGIQSLLGHYRTEASKIALRHRITGLARVDELTALPNRIALVEEIDGALATPAGDNSIWLHALMIEGLQEANRAHGYQVGDGLIRDASRRIAETVGQLGIPARLGGGHFAVLQMQPRHSSAAEALATRLARAFAAPLVAEGVSAPLAVRIGIADARPGMDAAAFLRAAEQAAARAPTVAGDFPGAVPAGT